MEISAVTSQNWCEDALPRQRLALQPPISAQTEFRCVDCSCNCPEGTTFETRRRPFRTFLRTLLHELCHHLDYELLDLDDSFHTEGFFKRESSLFKQLVDG